MLENLSLDIICSPKLSVPRATLSKTIRFSEQTKSADKYPSILLHQIEAIGYIF